MEVRLAGSFPQIGAGVETELKTMTIFQIIVAPLLALLFVERLAAVVRVKANRPMTLLWAAIWGGAAILVAWPRLSERLAKPFGIERGVDLVVYSAIIAMFIGLFMVYMRLRRQSQELTLLVRHLAIEKALAESGRVAADGKEESHGDAV